MLLSTRAMPVVEAKKKHLECFTGPYVVKERLHDNAYKMMDRRCIVVMWW